MNILEPIKSLKEPLFAKLYLAQTISLLGDAFSWVGIALLAFEFGGEKSAEILATALTLRVTAFIIFGSFAGVLADIFNRKSIMITADIARMFIVFTFPFVNEVWQVYLLIFLLNVFNAFFTPAYKACIPQLIKEKENYGNAIALSNGTWQLLGILGPGLAGGLAVLFGSRDLFFFDAFTFLISTSLVFLIPMTAIKQQKNEERISMLSIWKDIKYGSGILFQTPAIRFALLIELTAAIAGAQILVNTVGHVKGDLMLTNKEYGWIMTAFGIGATIAAFTANTVDKSKNKTRLLLFGAFMLAGAILFANTVSYEILLVLWILAGLGQSYTEMPSQILIAENIDLDKQGKVYGGHFAWSHLWWAIAYPIAGFTGTYFKNNDFLIGGIGTLILLILFCLYRFFNYKE